MTGLRQDLPEPAGKLAPTPMRDTVYLLLFDGYADWEPALAACEIRKHGGFELVTVGFDDHTVTSMGGFQVLPAIRLDDLDPERAVMLILPGGDRWEDPPESNALEKVLLDLRHRHVPLAAICGATLALARAGLLKGIKHTSNGLNYLVEHVPSYDEDELYQEVPAVRHRHIITANGAGYVEFTREVLGLLRIYPEDELEIWYDLFKKGVMSGLR
ncbi:MAG: glutamine amidotransferase [Candidatus Xenobia bacterium]